MVDERKLSAELLPDSRIMTPKGSVFRNGVWWQPIFCANCGAEGGLVPEENTTFVFWLCTPCFEKHGELTNMLVMPDEVYWEQVKQEQLEKYGRILTNEELAAVAQSDTSPLATLINRGRSQGR